MIDITMIMVILIADLITTSTTLVRMTTDMLR